MARAIFGEINPGGKLPIPIPRSAGHVPAYYNHKPSARRGYLFDDVSPLYAFGFGLSYTTFALDNVRLEASSLRRDGTTRVIFGPLDFIARLAALVPKPRVNLTRFHIP